MSEKAVKLNNKFFISISLILICFFLDRFSKIYIINFFTKNDFNEIIGLINKYKIIQECYQKAQHYINLASNSLSVFKDSKEKNILKMF